MEYNRTPQANTHSLLVDPLLSTLLTQIFSRSGEIKNPPVNIDIFAFWTMSLKGKKGIGKGYLGPDGAKVAHLRGLEAEMASKTLPPATPVGSGFGWP